MDGKGCTLVPGTSTVKNTVSQNTGAYSFQFLTVCLSVFCKNQTTVKPPKLQNNSVRSCTYRLVNLEGTIQRRSYFNIPIAVPLKYCIVSTVPYRATLSGMQPYGWGYLYGYKKTLLTLDLRASNNVFWTNAPVPKYFHLLYVRSLCLV